MNSRTEELKQSGATMRGGESGDGSPFVKWPDEEYAFMEGRVTDTWEGKYGLNATFSLSNASSNLGLDGSDVNVGMNHASLRDKITEQDVGTHFHIAFEGWIKSKGGNRYRDFTVLVIDPPANNGQDPVAKPTAEPLQVQNGSFDVNDDLPF